MNVLTPRTLCRRRNVLALALGCVVAVIAGCASTGEVEVGGSVYMGVGYYDPWYWGPGYYVPPPSTVGPPPSGPVERPPRPTHPIATPPPSRPTPMPRPAARSGGGRRR